MKKSYLIAIILIIVGGFTGFFLLYGGDETDLNEGLNSSNKETNEEVTAEYKFFYSGVNVTPGSDFDSSLINEKANKSTITSCAFEGLDNVYTYSNVEITANESNDKEMVYSVYLLDDSIETPEGVKVTDEKSDMIDAYGDNYTEDGGIYTYTSTSKDVKLNFTINNGVIVGIEYIYIIK